MSIEFGEWMQTPRSRRVCIAGTALLIAHLYWSCPLPGQNLLRKLVTNNE